MSIWIRIVGRKQRGGDAAKKHEEQKEPADGGGGRWRSTSVFQRWAWRVTAGMCPASVRESLTVAIDPP
jgi:hypothetical protein